MCIFVSDMAYHKSNIRNISDYVSTLVDQLFQVWTMICFGTNVNVQFVLFSWQFEVFEYSQIFIQFVKTAILSVFTGACQDIYKRRCILFERSYQR